ncbi:MAG TPA: hypothetical protein VGD80_11145 [Kofleriaceae bacterium]
MPSLSQAVAPRDPLRRISMTHTDDPSLSQIELVVLARLSCSKTPTTDELGKAIIGSDPSIALPRPVQDVAADTLSALRRRGLVRDKAKKLTDDGARTLRAIFGVSRTPNWSDIQSRHLPAVGLGLQPGTDDARKALRDAGTIGAALLQGKLDGELSPTLGAAADALIIKLLDLEPGPLTLARIRTQVLAREMRSELKRKPKKKTVVHLVTEHTLGEPLTNRASIGHALARRGFARLGKSPNGHGVERPREAPPAPPAEPTRTEAPPTATTAPPTAPPTGPQIGPPSSRPLEAMPADMLLTLVREAIPRIGSDGRFGPEKVFVSAIWHRIESDSRLPELSLERFKRWLVTANRDQLLDLARADRVGAMDAKLVAESEIRDLGSTFHFVVDRRAAGSGRGFHAR